MSEIEYGTREDILEADDHLVKEIVVPEFGGKRFRIRGLSGLELERYQASLGVYSKNGEIRSKSTGVAIARLVRMSVVDANDKQIFSEEDVTKLARKNAAGLSRIADVCKELSGLTDRDMEELEGDLDDDRSDSSSSSLRSVSVEPSMSSSVAAGGSDRSARAN